MRSQIFNEEILRIASFLTGQKTGIISTIGFPGVWAIPVWYTPHFGPSGIQSLKVDCLVPRWADVAHFLNKERRVLLIVQASSSFGLRWLQIQGTVQPVQTPDWACFLGHMVSILHPDSLYLVVRLTPSRIDLVDEEVGWGIQDTLEW